MGQNEYKNRSTAAIQKMAAKRITELEQQRDIVDNNPDYNEINKRLALLTEIKKGPGWSVVRKEAWYNKKWVQFLKMEQKHRIDSLKQVRLVDDIKAEITKTVKIDTDQRLDDEINNLNSQIMDMDMEISNINDYEYKNDYSKLVAKILGTDYRVVVQADYAKAVQKIKNNEAGDVDEKSKNQLLKEYAAFEKVKNKIAERQAKRAELEAQKDKLDKKKNAQIKNIPEGINLQLANEIFYSKVKVAKTEFDAEKLVSEDVLAGDKQLQELVNTYLAFQDKISTTINRKSENHTFFAIMRTCAKNNKSASAFRLLDQDIDMMEEKYKYDIWTTDFTGINFKEPRMLQFTEYPVLKVLEATGNADFIMYNALVNALYTKVVNLPAAKIDSINFERLRSRVLATNVLVANIKKNSDFMVDLKTKIKKEKASIEENNKGKEVEWKKLQQDKKRQEEDKQLRAKQRKQNRKANIAFIEQYCKDHSADMLPAIRPYYATWLKKYLKDNKHIFDSTNEFDKNFRFAKDTIDRRIKRIAGVIERDTKTLKNGISSYGLGLPILAQFSFGKMMELLYEAAEKPEKYAEIKKAVEAAKAAKSEEAKKAGEVINKDEEAKKSAEINKDEEAKKNVEPKKAEEVKKAEEIEKIDFPLTEITKENIKPYQVLFDYLYETEEFKRCKTRQERLENEFPEYVKGETEDDLSAWKDIALQKIIFYAEDKEFEKVVEAMRAQVDVNKKLIQRLAKEAGFDFGEEKAVAEITKKLGVKMLLSASAAINVEVVFMLENKAVYAVNATKLEANFNKAFRGTKLPYYFREQAVAYIKNVGASVESKKAVETALESFAFNAKSNMKIFDELVKDKTYTDSQWKELQQLQAKSISLVDSEFKKAISARLSELDKNAATEGVKNWKSFISADVEPDAPVLKVPENNIYKQAILNEGLCSFGAFEGAFEQDYIKEAMLKKIEELLKNGAFKEQIPALEGIKSLAQLENISYIDFNKFIDLLKKNINKDLKLWNDINCLGAKTIKIETLTDLLQGQLTEEIIMETSVKYHNNSSREEEAFRAKNLVLISDINVVDNKKLEFQYTEASGKNDAPIVKERLNRFNSAQVVWDKIWKYTKADTDYSKDGALAIKTYKKLQELLESRKAAIVDDKDLLVGFTGDLFDDKAKPEFSNALKECFKKAYLEIKNKKDVKDDDIVNFAQKIITEFLSGGYESQIIKNKTEGFYALYHKKEPDYVLTMAQVNYDTLQRINRVIASSGKLEDQCGLEVKHLLKENYITRLSPMAVRFLAVREGDTNHDANEAYNKAHFGCKNLGEFLQFYENYTKDQLEKDNKKAKGDDNYRKLIGIGIFKNEEVQEAMEHFKARKQEYISYNDGVFSNIFPYLLDRTETWEHIMMDSDSQFKSYLDTQKDKITALEALAKYPEPYVKDFIAKNADAIIDGNGKSEDWKRKIDDYVKYMMNVKVDGKSINKRLEELKQEYFKKKGYEEFYVSVEASIVVGLNGFENLKDDDALKKFFKKQRAIYEENSKALDEFAKAVELDEETAMLFRTQLANHLIWEDNKVFKDKLLDYLAHFDESEMLKAQELEEAKARMKTKAEFCKEIEESKKESRAEINKNKAVIHTYSMQVWQSASPILAVSGVIKQIKDEELADAQDRVVKVLKDGLYADPVKKCLVEIILADSKKDLKDHELKVRADYLQATWKKLEANDEENPFQKQDKGFDRSLTKKKRFLVFCYLHKFIHDDLKDTKTNKELSLTDIYRKYSDWDLKIREQKLAWSKMHPSLQLEVRDTVMCLQMALMTTPLSEVKTMFDKRVAYFEEQDYLNNKIDEYIASKSIELQDATEEYKNQLKQGMREMLQANHKLIDKDIKFTNSKLDAKAIEQKENICNGLIKQIATLQKQAAAKTMVIESTKEDKLANAAAKRELVSLKLIIHDLEKKLIAVEPDTIFGYLDKYFNNKASRDYIANSASIMGAVYWKDLRSGERQNNALDRRLLERVIERTHDKERIDKFNKLDVDQRKLLFLKLSMPLEKGNSTLPSAIWYNDGIIDQTTSGDQYTQYISSYFVGDKFEPVIDYHAVLAHLIKEDYYFDKKAFDDAYNFVNLCTVEKQAMIPKDWERLDGAYHSIDASLRVLTSANDNIKELAKSRVEESQKEIASIKELKEWLIKHAEKEGTDTLAELNKLNNSDWKILIQLLQNRTVLDYTTGASLRSIISGTPQTHVNIDGRARLVNQLKDSTNSGNLKLLIQSESPECCTKAMLTLLSFQLKDHRDLRNKQLVKKDFAKGALDRTTLLDWNLLKQAIKDTKTIKQEILAVEATQRATEIIQHSTNNKAKEVYKKIQDNKDFGGYYDAIKIIAEQAEIDMANASNGNDIALFVASLMELTPQERNLFFLALTHRDILDVSKKNMIGNFFGDGERDYVNPAARNALIDKYIEYSDGTKAVLPIKNKDYKQAILSLLSTQISDNTDFLKVNDLTDAESWENVHFSFKNMSFETGRTTAIDWKLFGRALQFVHRASSESHMLQEDKAIYYAGSQTHKNGEFKADTQYLRKNLHRTGNRWTRALGQYALREVKGKVSGLSVIRSALILATNKFYDKDLANKLAASGILKPEEEEKSKVDTALGFSAYGTTAYQQINENDVIKSSVAQANSYLHTNISVSDGFDNFTKKVGSIGKVVGEYGQNLIDAKAIFDNFAKICDAANNVSEIKNIYDDSKNIKGEHELNAVGDNQEEKWNQQGLIGAGQIRADAALDAAKARVIGDQRGAMYASMDSLMAKVCEKCPGLDNYADVVSAGFGFVNFLDQIYTDHKTIDKYYRIDDKANYGYGRTKLFNITQLLKHDPFFKNKESLSKESPRYLLQRTMGFENEDEMSREVMLEMIRVMLFSASKYNEDAPNKAKAVAALTILECAEAIGKTDNATAEQIYAKLANRA